MAQDGFIFKGCWSNSHCPSLFSPILEGDTYCYDINEDKQPCFFPDIIEGSFLICLKKMTKKEDKMDLKKWKVVKPEEDINGVL